MKAFTKHTGIVAPLDIANVDTDMIIPKQFLKSIKRSGFGPYLFDEMRYQDQGLPDMDCTNRPLKEDFVLNQERYKPSSILVSRRNFGCGSSREHAPWALEGYGFRCVIAPSFADIFFNNCFKNGILPIVLTEEQVEELFVETYANEGYELTVDLESNTITKPSGDTISFEVNDFRKDCLLKGLDDIALTLEQSDAIKAFEDQHRQKNPWLFR